MENTLRFIHTSDLQLGMARHFLDADAQARFDEARRTSIEKIGQYADDHKCQFIIIAGDVFEYNSVSRQTESRANEAFRRINVPVFVLPGNHDPLSPDSILRRVEKECPNVTVLDGFKPYRFDVSEYNATVEIIGAPLKTKRADTDLVRQAIDNLGTREQDDIPCYRVVVGHGAVQSYGADAPGVIDAQYASSRIADGTIDYVALGDTHSTQECAPGVWYSGSPETTDYIQLEVISSLPTTRSGDISGEHALEHGGKGETNSGNFLAVELPRVPGQGVYPTPDVIAAGTWNFEALMAHINSRKDVDHFLSTLDNYPKKTTTVIKYGLVGTLGLADYEYLQQGIAQLVPRFAALYPRASKMQLYIEPTDDDWADLGLHGYPRSVLEELSRNQSTDALNLMFRLIKQHNIG